MSGGSALPGPQLPLGLSLAPGATFAAFFTGPNALALAFLREMAAGQGERQVLLHGAAGLGKSHLLQAVCHEAARNRITGTYIPLERIDELRPDMFEGLETLGLIALDDVHKVAGDPHWERALFSLINRVREQSARLVMASRHAPSALGFALPDLPSRLAWGPVVRLSSLDDEARRDAVAHRAELLGLVLPAPALDYLLRHYRRDLASLLTFLDDLDRASLAAGRRLTVPFIRERLEARDSGQES